MEAESLEIYGVEEGWIGSHRVNMFQTDFPDGVDGEGREKRKRPRIDLQKPVDARPAVV